MSIVTDSVFNQYLVLAGLTVGSTDRSLLLSASEEATESLCRREFSLQTYNETIEIKPHELRRYSVKTKQYPIVGSSVILTDTSTLIANSDLIIEEGSGIIKLRADDKYFNTGRDAILLMYNGGWTTANAPADLVRLISNIGVMIKSFPGAAYQSEAIGDYRYKMSESQIEEGLDSINKAVLNKYRRIW